MRTPQERFDAHYTQGTPGECWEWQGKRWTNGYGCFFLDGKRTTGAHRAAWAFVNGSIPDGLEIDHLCRNRACVNPAHMEVVTHAENMRRATGWKKEAVTHCKWGHAFDGENTGYDTLGKRVCRMCSRERQRKYRGERIRPSSRPCSVCGTVFTPDRHPTARYCSGACRQEACRQRKKE